ncbi:MAG: hypothetical protein HY901_37010 [Deltaproteobacteria bacterium]|nr:hypothetical protein [Deltaproteobacteria bacterium]
MAAPVRRLHLAAQLFGDAISLQGGAKLGASYTLGGGFDLGAMASLGSTVGGSLGLSFHPGRGAHLLAPLFQISGIIHPVPGSVAWGGGLWLGGTIEAFRGRAVLGVEGNLYYGPSNYYPYALLGTVGYELDLF